MSSPFQLRFFRLYRTLPALLYTLLSSFFLIPSLKAETLTASALSWDACLSETLQKQPSLRAKEAAYRQAQANTKIARGQLFPQISATAGVNRSASQDTLSSSQASTHYSAGLSGQQLLWDGLGTLYDWEQADYRAQAALAAYQSAQIDAWLAARQAFIELLRAQADLGLTQDILTRRQQNLDLVALRYRAGREHHGSLALAQAQLAQAQADQKKAQRNILLAQESLCQAMGRTTTDALSVSGTLAGPSLPPQAPDLPHLIKAHPQYLQAQCQWEAARIQNNASWSSLYPSLYANAALNRTGDEWFPSHESWSAGLSLSWTLFNGGKRWGTFELNQAVEDQAQAQLDTVTLQLRSTLLSNYIAWQNAAESVTVTQQFLTATEERAKIAEAQYSTGLITFDNWILIENDLVSAKKSLLTAQAQALNAHADWTHARGGAEHE